MCKTQIFKGYKIEFGEDVKDMNNEEICRIPVIFMGECEYHYVSSLPDARETIDYLVTDKDYKPL